MTDAGTPPHWLADEMLGRLARYLRFLGYDTEYVRGESDARILDRMRREARTLLTRDRALAARASPCLLLTSPNIEEQLRAVQRAFPGLGFVPRFDRCTLCNGELAPGLESGPTAGMRGEEGRAERPVFVCRHCHHRYWEGSHTAQIRRQLVDWGLVPRPE